MRVRTLNDEIEKLASYLIQNQASKKSEQWSFRLKFPTRVVKFKSSELLHRTVLYKIRGVRRSVQEPAFFGGAGSGELDQQSFFLQINWAACESARQASSYFSESTSY